MKSICEEKISAEVGLIHAEQISLYKFQQAQLKTKQVKQAIFNQWESMGFSKLKCKFKYGFSIVYQKERKEKEIKAVFLDLKKKVILRP